jgi:exodeoxyribonuclease VII large subunit
LERKPSESLSFDFSRTIPTATGAQPEPERAVLRVAELGRMLTRSLDRAFAAPVWVQGEVSGARPAASGHVYWLLKDEEEDAAIDVVLYRTNVTPKARALIQDGARLRLRGRPMFWSPRGRLQFVVDRVEPTGKGALLEAIEKLKAKLKAEGLFDSARKRALPHEPRIIGVVTSAHGAVIHDICKVAFRRGGAHILLAPAQVQGAGAALSVRRALAMLESVAKVDVIVIGRGGGSHDDLLAFNDEELVRAVAACPVPVVSAVGHEVDVTLIDFAADARAATPSQAAEMIVPDLEARKRLLAECTLRLVRAMHARLADHRVHSANLAKAFGDPRLLIAGAQQRIDDRMARLHRIVFGRLSRHRDGVQRLGSRLGVFEPRNRIARDRAGLFELCGRLAQSIERRVLSNHTELGKLDSRLDAMSPLKVLGRGYAVATRADGGQVIRAAGDVAVGERVLVRVACGAFLTHVAKVANEANEMRGVGKS